MARKYSLDEESFEKVADEETAYWLGFLCADGSVSIAPRSVMRIELANKDVNHLYNLRSFLKSNQPLYKDRRGKGTTILAIGSKRLVRNLISLGCIPRKTHVLEYSNSVPEYLDRHFIRGVFDGDGSIGIYERIDTRREQIYHHKELIFRLCGTKGILLTIKEKLEEQLGVHVNIRPMKNIYLLHISRFPDVQKSLDYLYKDSSVRLPRKYEQYLQAMLEIQARYPHRRGVRFTAREDLDIDTLVALYHKLKSSRAVSRHLENQDIYTSYHTITKRLREHGVTVAAHPSGWERKKQGTQKELLPKKIE